MTVQKSEILYIDDEEFNLSALRYSFRGDYKIHIALSANEGWEILQVNPIKVVISDQRMPGLTGVQFLEKVALKYPHITRILITGYTDAQDIIAAINQSKIYQFVKKPWKKEELRIIFNNAIALYDLKIENQQLLTDLKEKNTSLESINQNLEEKIEKRTRELEIHKNSLETLVNERTKELNSEKEFINTLIDSLPGVLYLFELKEGELELLKVNKKYIETTGYKWEEIHGANENFDVDENDLEKLHKAIEKILNDGYAKATIGIKTRTGIILQHSFEGHLINRHGKQYILVIGIDISKRVKIEQELKEEKEFSETLIDGLPAIFYLYKVKNETNTLIKWNKLHETALGYAPEELINKEMHEFFEEKEHHKFRSGAKEVGNSRQVEVSIIDNRTKQSIPYLLSSKRFNRKGDDFFFGIGFDISERVKAEKNAHKGKVLTEKIINGLPGIFYMFEVIGESIQLVKWNKNFEKDLGYKSEELAGKSAYEFIPKEKLVEFGDALSNLQTQGSTRKEFSLICSDGNYSPVYSLEAQLFMSEQNAFVIGTGLDISERVLAEKELELYKDQLESLVESRTFDLERILSEQKIILNNIGLGVAFLVDRKIKWSNKALSKMLGFVDQGISEGTSVSFLYKNETDFLDYGNKVYCILAKGERFIGERILYKKDRSTFWCRLTGNAVDIHDESKGSIWIFEDISKRKKGEEELKEAKEKAEAANHAKSEFLASMSHEIRTPMNAVLGFTEILRERMNKDSENYDYLERINNAGRNLIRLINDILDLSKVEAGRIEIQRSSVNPCNIIREIEHIFQHRINQKGLVFEIISNKHCTHPILFDEVRLRQMLFNLVGNAVKFTTHGKVKVISKLLPGSRKNKANYIIEVHDSGQGIPKDQLEHIFEVFIQKEGQKYREYGGTGLGLAITKKLAETMNGKLTVKSVLNKGSVFTLEFKDVEISKEKPRQEEFKVLLNPEEIKFKESKVLLVEDIADNREIIRLYLKGYNITLFEGVNGKEGIELAKTKKPDVILMDTQMPVMDGFEASRILKEMELTNQIPILAFSASAMKEQQRKALKHCDGFLSKPISKSKLVNELSKFLPFEQIELTDENQLKENAPAVNMQKLLEGVDLSEYPESLLEYFQNKLLPVYHELNEGISMQEGKEFIDLLITACETYDIYEFKVYSSAIEKELSLYNVDEVERLISYFEVFSKP